MPADPRAAPASPGSKLSAEEASAVVADLERKEPERIAAAERLGALAHRPAIDALFGAWASAEVYLARAIAAALKAMDAGAEVAKGLLSPDPKARVRAAERLQRLADPRTEAACTAGLRDPEPRARQALVGALARMGTPAAAAQVDRALSDRDAGVRAVAAAGIGARRGPAAAAALRAALGSEKDDVVRDCIERAIRAAEKM